MLYGSKAIDRMGKVTDGNTVSDFDPDEIKKGFSLSTSIIPIEWKNTKINLIDAPGFLDFKAEALQAARAADAMIITVDGKSGLEVGAELAWEIAEDEVLPRAVFVSKCDDPEASFDRVFAQLRDEFGTALCPVIIPIKEADGTTMIDLIGMTAFRYDDKGGRIG
jgi:elongation factor G